MPPPPPKTERRAVVLTPPRALAVALHLVGLRARIEVSRLDGEPLTSKDLPAMAVVLDGYDVNHGQPASEADTARIQERFLAALDGIDAFHEERVASAN